MKFDINSKWLALAAPFFAAAGLALLLILHYGVNTPYWDEWELVPIFQHLHAGHFLWSDFWAQHNEHRLLFPNLALTGLAYLTRWNLLVESLVAWCVAVGSFVLLRRMVPRSLNTKSDVLLLSLLALVWFSPVQVENWLWGWQLEWFMNVLGVMLVAFGISRIRGKYISYRYLALLLAGGILAQYSLGSGMLVWPIVILTLLYLRVQTIKAVLVAFVAGLSTFAYYFHYVNPAEPSKTLAIHEPIRFAKYVLGYLGRPLSFPYKPAAALGFVLLVLFVSLSVYLLVRQKTVFRASLPWVVLGLYAIGSALITGLARLGFGVPEAFSSRYTTISSLLLVSVIMLCWQSRVVLRKLVGSTYKVAMPLVVLGLFCLVIVEWGWGIHSANTEHAKLETIRQCTGVSQPTADCLTLTYPSLVTVTPRLQYIKSIHWAGY